MPPTRVNANGHRRRQVVTRVKAEETHCALCGQWVDQTLHHLDPMSAVVDEDVPRSRGGSQYDRSNCHLMHRRCNRWKSSLTLAEAKLKMMKALSFAPTVAPIKASNIW